MLGDFNLSNTSYFSGKNWQERSNFDDNHCRAGVSGFRIDCDGGGFEWQWWLYISFCGWVFYLVCQFYIWILLKIVSGFRIDCDGNRFEWQCPLQFSFCLVCRFYIWILLKMDAMVDVKVFRQYSPDWFTFGTTSLWSF